MPLGGSRLRARGRHRQDDPIRYDAPMRVVAALVALATAASSVQLDAQQLDPDAMSFAPFWRDVCSGRRTDAPIAEQRRMCSLYLIGFSDADYEYRKMKQLYCPPPHFNIESMRQAFLTYMMRHDDEYVPSPAGRAILLALAAAYPCKQ